MLDLWWTKCHWGRLFPYQSSFHTNCPILSSANRQRYNARTCLTSYEKLIIKKSTINNFSPHDLTGHRTRTAVLGSQPELRCGPVRDSNRVPFEYKYEALPVNMTCSFCGSFMRRFCSFLVSWHELCCVTSIKR